MRLKVSVHGQSQKTYIFIVRGDLNGDANLGINDTIIMTYLDVGIYTAYEEWDIIYQMAEFDVTHQTSHNANLMGMVSILEGTQTWEDIDNATGYKPNNNSTVNLTSGYIIKEIQN